MRQKNLKFAAKENMNKFNHTFALDTEKNLLIEYFNFGFIFLHIAFSTQLIKIIDAWHFIELELIKMRENAYIFAASYILNEMILNKISLTPRNIENLLIEYNKNPQKFLLLEYLKDLKPSELKDFCNTIDLGQTFENFTMLESIKEIGQKFEAKAPQDKDFLPALLFSRNGFYDLILTKTRDTFNFGIFPALNDWQIREFNPENWLTSEIEAMEEINEKAQINISELIEKISTKANKQAEKIKADAAKELEYNENYGLKILHLEAANDLKELKANYTEARKKDFHGSISRAQMINLSEAYKLIEAAYIAENELKKAEDQAKEDLQKAKKNQAKAESKEASKQPEQKEAKKENTPEASKPKATKTKGKKAIKKA